MTDICIPNARIPTHATIFRLVIALVLIGPVSPRKSLTDKHHYQLLLCAFLTLRLFFDFDVTFQHRLPGHPDVTA